MKLLKYSFLLILSGVMYGALQSPRLTSPVNFQNIELEMIPMPKDVEEAVAEFNRQLKRELGSVSLVNFGKLEKEFRNKLILQYMPKWRQKISNQAPLTQIVDNAEIPMFQSQISELVEQFKKEQDIVNKPEYKKLIDAYRFKLEFEAIEDQPVLDYLMSFKIHKIVNSQVVMPSEEGITMLVYQIAKDLKNADLSKVEENLKNALVQKFYKKIR